MVLASALLAILLALLVAHDLFRRRTELGLVSARRDRAPRTYWALIGLSALCFVACLAVLTERLTDERKCLPAEHCYLLVKVVP